MSRTVVLTCDCGCEKEVKPGGFSLEKAGIPICFSIDSEKIRISSGGLHFVDLEHLNIWLQKALTEIPVLIKHLKENPQFERTIFAKEAKGLYV